MHFVMTAEKGIMLVFPNEVIFLKNLLIFLKARIKLPLEKLNPKSISDVFRASIRQYLFPFDSKNFKMCPYSIVFL